MVGSENVSLGEGWQLARTPAGRCATPQDLAGFPAQWHEASVPGTAAASLRHDLNSVGNYDADDWWYRRSFPAAVRGPGARYRLRFEGLASLATAWLNGTPILTSRNMFVAHRVDVTALLRKENQLVIAFHSLDAALAEKSLNTIVDIALDLRMPAGFAGPDQQTKVERVLTEFQELHLWRRINEHILGVPGSK